MRSLGYIVSCTFMARACVALSAVARGRAVVAEGLSLARQSGQHYCDAELHRLDGELLLAHGPEEAEAERCFIAGLDIARTQRARLLELRVALSIARLRQRQGREADGLHLLQPIYGWFQEGLETPDLRHARTLLNELAS
jgi:predicted ATPase